MNEATDYCLLFNSYPKCDWIWESQLPYTHNYKYWEIPKFYYYLSVVSQCCISGRKSDACMQFPVILEPFIVYLCTNNWLDSYVAEKLATLDSCSTGIANITSTPMEVEDIGGGQPWSGR